MFEWVLDTPLKSADIAAHYETPFYLMYRAVFWTVSIIYDGAFLWK